MSYYNAPPNYGGSFPPPFPQQQSPPHMAYNAYSPPTGYEHPPQQYSPVPAGQPMYGLEPTTPVLDQNQMNYFWNEVRSGNIPTISSAQQQAPPFPPPQPQPQPQSQTYAPQYQYSPYTNSQQTSPTQNSFQPSSAQYNVGRDVPMTNAVQDDGAFSDEGEDYSPPDITSHGTNGMNNGLPGLGQIALGKRPVNGAQESPSYQPPPFNPFKPLSHYDPPLPAPPVESRQPARQAPIKQQARQNAELRDKAGNVVKDFHTHGIGYLQLAQEPSFDDFDRDLLRQLYTQYKIPQEPQIVTPLARHEQTGPKPAAHEDARIAELKKVLGGAGYVLDDAALATLAGSMTPAALAHAPALRQEAATISGIIQQDLEPTPPTRSLSNSAPNANGTPPNEGRSAYLAKLKAMKGKGAAGQKSSLAQNATQSSLPGLGTSTPRRIIINRDALHRKLQAQREAQARAAKESLDEPLEPHVATREDSASSINYDSEQVSARSRSDAGHAPLMEMSSPEEGEELEDGQEDEGEIIETPPEQPSTAQPLAAIPGLPPKPSGPQLSNIRNDSDQSAKASPRAGQPVTQPPASRKPYPYPPAVRSPATHVPWQPDAHLKRPASSAFGGSWDPRAKRPYPPVLHEPEPLVIDLSSEDEGEVSDDEMDEDEDDIAQPNKAKETDQATAQIGVSEQPRTPWKPQVSSGQSSSFATPPVITTPDPAHATRVEDQVKQKALLAAKKEALKKQIQLKEAQKKQLASGIASPAAAAGVPTFSSPATVNQSTKPLSAFRASSVASKILQTRNASSPLPTSLQGRSSSAARESVVKSLEADIRSDEDQMQALQIQMEKLRHELARKNAEKEKLSEEIMAFGVNPEQMTHTEMQEVRDALVEAAGNAHAQSDGEDSKIEDEFDIREADDPRAVESGSRVQIHNIDFTQTKRDIQNFVGRYDITGISLPIHGNYSAMTRKKAGYALVDFLYPAEAQEAVKDLSGSVLAGRQVHLQILKITSGVNDSNAVSSNCLFVRGIPQGDLRNAAAFRTWLKITRQYTLHMPPAPAKKPRDDWAIIECGSLREAGEMLQALRSRKLAKKPLRVEPYKSQVPWPRTAGQAPAPAQSLFVQALAGQTAQSSAGQSAVRDLLAEYEDDVDEPSPDSVTEEDEEDDEEEDEDEDDSEEKEGDDDDESEDAMSVSDDDSEEGEVNDEIYGAAQQQPQSIISRTAPLHDDVDEDSDDMDESAPGSGSDDDEEEEDEAHLEKSADESDDSDEESADDDVAADIGVSLKDIEDVPMDDDDVSEDDSESEAAQSVQPSDDEEEDVDEVEDDLPAAQTELTMDSDAVETDSEDEVLEDREPAQVFPLAPNSQVELQVRSDEIDSNGKASEQKELAENSTLAPQSQIDGQVEQNGDLVVVEESLADPVVPDLSSMAATSSDTPQHQSYGETDIVQETMLVDDNDDDFYEPELMEGQKSAVPESAPTHEAEDEDDYDPDFDAAFEEAFADMDNEAKDLAGDMSHDSMQQQQEGGAQPDRDSGIPGLGMQNGEHQPLLHNHGDAEDAMELSEEGEIVSESGGASSPAGSTNALPSLSVPAYADIHTGEGSAFPSHHRYHDPEERIAYPIPKVRVLGTPPKPAFGSANTIITPASAIEEFTPYQSPLRAFKAYLYHPDYLKTVAGGFTSLTYSYKIDAFLPLCPVESEGAECKDAQCPGQHVRDMVVADQDIIRFLGTFDTKNPSKELHDRWTHGLRLLIESIRKDGLTRVDDVASRVAAYRREFFGGSIFDFDLTSRKDEGISVLKSSGEEDGEIQA